MTTHSARRTGSWLRLPAGRTAPRISYGADYNPDQWTREVWEEDVRLMQEANVDVVSLAIFSWARIQPTPDTWDLDWLDEVMDLLHGHGVGVALSTPTASPPPWLSRLHPEILPVTRTGETVWPGARQHWRPTSPIFRRYALELVEVMARRYADHPALVLWHISNELGCHNVYDFSDDAAEAFRAWLRARYSSLDRLNHAWGTAFWSQRYSSWEEILPPRLAPTHPNPTQQLDFRRFSSDALKEHLRAERDLLRGLSPDVPVTTNFIVMGARNSMNYADWAAEVDVISNNHYVIPGPQSRDELSFSANLTGHIAGRAPWFLMEHSTSAVNWQPINRAKRSGEMVRDSLTHVAHGADAVAFFQWRQSVAGAEKYHSAMLPHAGRDSDVFKESVRLGAILRSLDPVATSRRVPARIAVLFDWESWWASEQDSHPTERLRYHDEALDWYSALMDAGVRADVVPTGSPLDEYDMVVAPVLHMVPEALGEELERYVAGGGHLVATYFSGVVDENDHIWPGGYPGPLASLLGVRVLEIAPLLDEESVLLDDGTVGTIWTERIVAADDVDVLARYADGEQAGRPAVTRRRCGDGSAAYVSTRLGAAGLAGVVRALVHSAGVRSELPDSIRGAVELTVRTNGEEEFWFFLNRSDAPVRLPDMDGDVVGSSEERDLPPDAGPVILPVRGVAVLRRPSSS